MLRRPACAHQPRAHFGVSDQGSAISGALTSKMINDAAEFDSADPIFLSVAGDPLEAIILFIDTADEFDVAPIDVSGRRRDRPAAHTGRQQCADLDFGQRLVHAVTLVLEGMKASQLSGSTNSR